MHRSRTTNGVTFVIDRLIKSSKVGRANATVQLTAFPHDDSLCVVALFKMYLQKTRSLRGKEKQLFLSYVPPHKAIGSETISRWIKFTLKAAGIDTVKFTAHSTRSAACSAALRNGVSLDIIMKTAGWTRCSTFARFYNKLLDNESSFAQAVLAGDRSQTV